MANGQVYINKTASNSTLTDATTNGYKGIYNLANNPAHFEIQRNNNFEFYIEGLAKEMGYSNVEGMNEDIIRVSVSKAFVPHFTQGVIEVKRGNSTMKFAGAPTFSNGQLDLNDYIGAGTKEVLMAWQRCSYDVQTEKVGLAADYKRTGYLLEYTPDYQLVRQWQLDGCWISGLSESEFSHDSAEKHTIQCTIEYDRAFIMAPATDAAQ